MVKPKSDTPLAALEKLEQTRLRKPPTKKEPLPQPMLPLWPDAVRGIPNPMLRSSLFSVSKRRRMFRKSTLLAAVDGIEIRFKGEGFNQIDLDVFEMLLHLARQQPLGQRVEFTAHSLLKELGRSTGKTQHEQLKEEIRRLAAGLIEVSWPSKDESGQQLSFGGTLVEEYSRDERPDGTQRYVVVFRKRLVAFYYQPDYSHIDWQQRQSLTSNLSKWLHGFYASHAKPFPYKVETLKGLCGSTASRLTEFRRLLRKAMGELKTCGAIKGYEITDEDLVVVDRIPALSQQRHLRKRLK